MCRNIFRGFSDNSKRFDSFRTLCFIKFVLQAVNARCLRSITCAFEQLVYLNKLLF